MTQGLGNTLLQYLQSKMDNCTKNVGERAPTLVWWWSSPLSWWSPLPMNIKTTSRSTAMVSPKISLSFFLFWIQTNIDNEPFSLWNCCCCTMIAIGFWNIFTLRFDSIVHWCELKLFFSSNHFRREVSYCNEKEIHVEEQSCSLS